MDERNSIKIRQKKPGPVSKAITVVQFFRAAIHNRAPADCARQGSVNGVLLAAALVAGLIASGLVYFLGGVASPVNKAPMDPVHVSPTSSPGKRLYPVEIRKPAGPPQCRTGMTDADGNAVVVSCSTCHATRKPNFANRVVADLNEFHGSLVMSHGTISCLSCHNSNDYDALKLADGSRVEFTEVMTLCAQCHGPQMRDYEHGAHGGMTGYWDLTRGPRTKNNCIDCHNPHSPQFPKMQPTFKPRDRFLESKEH